MISPQLAAAGTASTLNAPQRPNTTAPTTSQESHGPLRGQGATAAIVEDAARDEPQPYMVGDD